HDAPAFTKIIGTLDELFFFFQAEDGIRDFHVTGVQRVLFRSETLEIEYIDVGENHLLARMPVTPRVHQPDGVLHGGASVALAERSEERRVGKECRARGGEKR